MAVIDTISQMKNQGVPTGKIIQSLKEQGYSPKEINEALSQSEIKTALTTASTKYGNNLPTPPNALDGSSNQQQEDYFTMPQSGFEDMQQSMELAQPRQENEQATAQKTQSDYSQQQVPQEYTTQQEYAPQTEYAQSQEFTQPQGFSQQQEYAPYAPKEYPYPEYTQPQGIDVETITDIATQIAEEKLEAIKKEVMNFAKFRRHKEEQMNGIEQRLDKIETRLEELQMSIIRKVGEYGENIQQIADELKATQHSFSKVLNPLADAMHDLRPKTKGKQKKIKNTTS